MKIIPARIENIEEIEEVPKYEREFLIRQMSFLEYYKGLEHGLCKLIRQLKKRQYEYKEYLPYVELFQKLCEEKHDLYLQEEQKEWESYHEKRKKIEQEILRTEQDEPLLEKLSECLYYENEVIMHIILQTLLGKKEYGEMKKEIPNIGFFMQMLEGDPCLFLIFYDEMADINWDILGNIISRLGHKVVILKEDVQIHTLKDAQERMQEYEDLEIWSYGEELSEILDYICSRRADKMLAVVLGTGHKLEQIAENTRDQRKIQFSRLTDLVSPYLENKITFGWCGKYTHYIGEIFHMDVEACLKRPATCRFSIVIPAKDSIDTLQYTIQTCLDQRWKGDFEIIVCDNSSDGRNEIYELCQNLKDKRIKYYRAPRPLIITKNFEYAILQAKGEFIFTLGSDDAIMPWTLEILNQVLERTESEVIMWERGQYQWPDYGEGISDQLVFPCAYQKGNWELIDENSASLLAMVMLEPRCMYFLPLCYINSGFRKSYIETVIQRTGRFLDGPCHDIYMGILNVCLYPNICKVNYLLTIAGMARKSTGATFNRHLVSVEQAAERAYKWMELNYIGGWTSSEIERQIPKFTTDIGVFYNCLLKAVERGVLQKDIVDKLMDAKECFRKLFLLMDKKDMTYERQMQELLYAAKNKGDLFYKWFLEEIYIPGMEPEEIEEIEEIKEEKTYSKKMVTEGGVVILDASELEIDNILGSVKLVEKISEL